MSPKWISLFVVCVVVCGMLDALPIDSEPSSVMENLEFQENAFGIQPSSEGGQVVREKRTIGFLRQLFPTLSQIIDRKVQAITRILFRLIGRLVLRGAGGGGGGGTDSDSSGGDNGRRVSITLPTFPPSAEDEDSTDSDDAAGTESSSDDTSTTTTEPSDSDNSVSESRVVPVLVRKVRQVQSEEEEEEDDQAAEATGDNELSSSVEETDDTDAAESVETAEDPRDKRLVNFNLGGGGSGGSGGGSGNFLFDIIRRAADRAARMAGTVYRVLAGTDDVGLPAYPSITNKRALVAGSGTTQSEDEANNAPLDDGNATAPTQDDGYSAGVPGPLTRLFVVANRGIANLIQDLILRLAQTSERIVNFKARLITSII